MCNEQKEMTVEEAVKAGFRRTWSLVSPDDWQQQLERFQYKFKCKAALVKESNGAHYIYAEKRYFDLLEILNARNQLPELIRSKEVAEETLKNTTARIEELRTFLCRMSKLYPEAVWSTSNE